MCSLVIVAFVALFTVLYVNDLEFSVTNLAFLEREKLKGLSFLFIIRFFFCFSNFLNYFYIFLNNFSDQW